MCLGKAFLVKDARNEFLMDNIASLEVAGEKVTLTSLFRESRDIEARIRKIDFANSSILLEPVPIDDKK